MALNPKQFLFSDENGNDYGFKEVHHLPADVTFIIKNIGSYGTDKALPNLHRHMVLNQFELNPSRNGFILEEVNHPDNVPSLNTLKSYVVKRLGDLKSKKSSNALYNNAVVEIFDLEKTIEFNKRLLAETELKVFIFQMKECIEHLYEVVDEFNITDISFMTHDNYETIYCMFKQFDLKFYEEGIQRYRRTPLEPYSATVGYLAMDLIYVLGIDHGLSEIEKINVLTKYVNLISEFLIATAYIH